MSAIKNVKTLSKLTVTLPLAALTTGLSAAAATPRVAKQLGNTGGLFVTGMVMKDATVAEATAAWKNLSFDGAIAVLESKAVPGGQSFAHALAEDDDEANKAKFKELMKIKKEELARRLASQ